MLFLCRYSIRHPRLVLMLAALVVILAAPGLLRLKLRTDGHALVPNDAPEVVQDRELREQFGLADSIVILIRSDSPEGIYNAHTISLVNSLTSKLQSLEGLKATDVFSLATEKGHRVRQGTLIFLTLLDPLPQTPAELATLHDDVDRIRLYRGTLVGDDNKATAIMVSVRNTEDRSELIHKIVSVIEGLGPLPERIGMTGAPVAESLLGTHILEDLGIPARLLGQQADALESGEKIPRSLEGLRLWIARHIGLLPIALGMMTVVFYLSFRSVTAVMLIWVKIGCCLLIVFGVMGWCGVPIYLTTAVIPVILTATGVSDEVHIFTRYAARRREGKSGDSATECMLDSMTEVWRPVTMTSVTTAIGFLSFVISPLGAVQAFGLFTGLGTMICMMWALTATPAMAVLIDFLGGSTIRENTGQLEAKHNRLSRMLARLGEWMLARTSRRVAILLSFTALLGAAGVGMQRIEIQDSWIDGFSPASGFYKTTQYFNDHFLGMHSLFVCVDTGNMQLKGKVNQSEIEVASLRIPATGFPADRPAESLVGQWIELRRVGDARLMGAQQPATLPPHRTQIVSATRSGDRFLIGIEKSKGSPRFSLALKEGDSVEYKITPQRLLDAKTLREIKKFEQFLAAHQAERVGGALGPAVYIETTNFMAQGRREESRMLPDKAEHLDYLWKWYANIRGADRMRATADADLSSAIISVYLKNANFRDTHRLLEEIAKYQHENLAASGISLRFAGDVAVSQALIDGITRTQISSIVLSIIGIIASAIAVHRSIRWGLLCAVPCALSVPLVFGIMGFVNMPLGVATSMLAAMAIGIGDDYAIHFIERYRLALDSGPIANRNISLLETFRAAGPGIVIDAVSVALGFGVMTFSQVPANARLGVMLLASILTCLVATLLLLPVLLRLSKGLGTPSHTTIATP